MMGKIISKFNEKPKTRAGWRAMWFGLPLLLIGPFFGTWAAAVQPLVNKIAGETVGAPIGLGVLIMVLVVTILALATGIKAFWAGERSWIMWLGFIPAILAALFWVTMIIGEFVFPH